MARWYGVVRVWLAVIMAAAGLSAAGSRPASAQDDVERVRLVVQQWVLKQLGKPNLVLVEYTYGYEVWPDSALGCPAESQTYTPGELQGYRWTLLFDNMVRYEVHSTLDGAQAVLCGSATISSDVRLTPYTTTTFTILIPEAWLVFPDDDQVGVLFAPQQPKTCGQPGMVVTVLGRVANGVTPDQLINDYLAASGVQDVPGERSTVGTFGQSTVFETACDTGMRRWRVSTFVQYGSAYRVEQWAPLDQWDRWSQLYLDMLSQFGPVDASSVGSSPESVESGGDAQNGTAPGDHNAALAPLPPLPMAHLFVGDIFLGALNDIPGRSVTALPQIERRDLAFSPDGLILSYIDVTNAQLRALNVAEGKSPRTLAEGIDPAFPPAWRADSQEIAFVVEGGQTGQDGASALEIRAVPAAGGEARTLGTFTLAGDCPVAYADPSDRLYYSESGPGGREPVLVWLANDQFLVSTRCDGGIGVLTLADGQVTELGGDLLGGIVAPDRTRFLARTPGGLAVLDFQVWQRTDFTTGQVAYQLGWGTAGQTVYYSTETAANSAALDDPADEARAREIFGFWPVTAAVNTITLVSLNLSNGQEAVIWQGQGRGIGRIAPAPDSSGLLFSLVPSGLPAIEVFQAGGDAVGLREAWPVPQLYWLPAGETAARLLSYSGQPAFAPVTVNAG